MRFVLLGSTGYHPNNLRQTACYMIPELGIVLDAGTAMFRVRERLVTSELDIYLSHAHLDHVMGLTFLFDVLYDRPMSRVTVHAEADKIAAINEHLLNPALFPVKLPCEYKELATPSELAGGGKITHFPLEHPGGSVGYRLDWPGHSLAYVTDTTACDDSKYVEAVRGVDLLVHECYFPDTHQEMAIKTGHSHTTPVANLARRAGVGRLLLIHVNPLVEAVDPINLEIAQAIFPETQLGVDNMEVDF